MVNIAGTTKYKNQWLKENTDRIFLVVPKGEKEEIKSHADKHNESINGFINRAIREAIERDNTTPTQ